MQTALERTEVYETQRPAIETGYTYDRIVQALDFDPGDFAASAASMYLLKEDDIIATREFVTRRVTEEWFIGKNKSFSPEPTDLASAAVIFIARAAIQTAIVLPDNRSKIENFWFHVGTALTGAEVEIFRSGLKTDSLPITSDGLFHNARRDRDQVSTKYSEMLTLLEGKLL